MESVRFLVVRARVGQALHPFCGDDNCRVYILVHYGCLDQQTEPDDARILESFPRPLNRDT